jgi:ABC-type nitrate/sulfonate/bicarbonate transport system permease component
MQIKNWFKPFEKIPTNERTIISIIWLAAILLIWVVGTMGTKHLFPNPSQVWEGFTSLYNEGLVVHIFSSLGLFLQAVLISLVVTLIIAYLSPVPFLKPLANVMSKFRYLPLAGLTYYLVIVIKTARTMQVSVLVIFMSIYLITSLLAVIKDIPQEEIDHARSLKCSRWETLWEVVVKGRLDYVLDVLRQNLAIIWMMLVTVESISVATGGLGVLIKNSDKFANQGRIVALQIVILLIGLFLDWALNAIRKSVFKYSTF